MESPLIFFNLEFTGLESVFYSFWFSKIEYNPGSENLKVMYIQCSMFYAIINYQFKTSELKNVEKLVKQTVQAVKSC